MTERALALERRVLDYYRSLRSGEATVTVKVSASDTRTWKLWFKGDRLRMEQFASRYEKPKQIVKADGKIYHRGVGIRADTGEELLGLPEIHFDDWNGTSLFDLRKLAVVAAPPGVLHSIDYWEHPLGDIKRSRQQIKVDVLNQEELICTDTLSSDGDRTSIWINEHRGPSLVRYKHTANVNGRVYIDIHTNELENYDGVWFPRRIVHQRYVNGWPLRPQITTLTDARFNHEIDDALFTFASVGVQPGHRVNIYTEGPNPPEMFWDGRQLQPVASRRPHVPVSPPPQWDGRGGWRLWMVTANLCAALVCLVLFLRRRSSPASAPTNQQ